MTLLIKISSTNLSIQAHATLSEPKVPTKSMEIEAAIIMCKTQWPRISTLCINLWIENIKTMIPTKRWCKAWMTGLTNKLRTLWRQKIIRVNRLRKIKYITLWQYSISLERTPLQRLHGQICTKEAPSPEQMAKKLSIPSPRIQDGEGPSRIPSQRSSKGPAFIQ